MAKEWQKSWTPGQTLYLVLVQTSSQKVWNGTTVETENPSHWSTYAIPFVDSSGLGEYFADQPATGADTWTGIAYLQSGGSPAPSDIKIGSITAYVSGQIVTSVNPAITVLSYGTVDAGNIYFQSRLYTDPWDNASTDDKQKALNSADDIIDQYAYMGQRLVVTQLREWPRRDLLIQGGWSVSFPSDVLQSIGGIPIYPGLPDEILKAEFEIAKALLDGVDIEAEARNRGVTSRSYASVRTTYDSSAVPEYILAGCPSAKAWTFLKPFLSPDNARGLTLRRVN